MLPISIEVHGSGLVSPPNARSAALAADPEREGVLRFRIRASAEGLAALLHARRAMIREEMTLGLREGEPSLEDAVFSAEEIVWPARADQGEICFEKVASLQARALRTVSESAGI